MTRYDKKRHDGVKAFVEALRRLEEKGIIKHCGKCIDISLKSVVCRLGQARFTALFDIWIPLSSQQ